MQEFFLVIALIFINTGETGSMVFGPYESKAACIADSKNDEKIIDNVLFYSQEQALPMAVNGCFTEDELFEE